MSTVAAQDIDRRLLAWTRGTQGTDTFERLILDIYRYQYAQNAAYRRWCASRGGTPDQVGGWRDIPAVPQAAFKEWTLATFDPTQAVARFDSSGTTRGTPSRHYFDTLALYEAAVIPPFQDYMLPDGAALACLALVPDPASHPHSSLAHMAGTIGRECCGGRITYFADRHTVDSDAFYRATDGLAEPVLIFTTAFALVHLLDDWETNGLSVRLAPGSRMMETGGYKGRTRTMPKEDLYRWASGRLGLDPQAIVNEYGMAELSSQWYDTTLRDACFAHGDGTRKKAGPTWARARVLDPRTGMEARAGEVGLIRLYDPMNRGSVCCIQTDDLGRVIGDAFEVLGRATGAELRGCSLDLDVF